MRLSIERSLKTESKMSGISGSLLNEILEGAVAQINRPSSYPEDPRARAPYGDSSEAGSL